MESNKISAAELRIGNLAYQVASYDEVLEKKLVVAWDESIWYRIGDCVDKIENYEPIHLTKEWLIKFGFRKENDFCFRSACTVFFVEISSIGEFDFHKIPQYDESGWLSTIKYIHQLQNLYFALTGQELEFTDVVNNYGDNNNLQNL